MIKIVAKNIVHEDNIETFINLAKDLVEKSQQEEGCIEYDIFQDIEKPFILTFIESWKDMDAIKTHGQTDHYLTIVPKLSDLTIKDSEVHLYQMV